MAYESGFASVYDRFSDDAAYEKRAAYLLGLLRDGGVTEGILLDVACGTGKLTALLCGKGYEIIAADVSPEMLQIARERLAAADPDALLLCQDMRALDLYGTVDAAVCTLDSVNHLTEEEDVAAAFRSVSLFLRPGGLYVFDVNTPFKHRQVLGGNTFVYEDEDAFLVWQNTDCDQEGRVDILLDVFTAEADGRYARASEDFTERAYEPERLCELLEQAGLAVEGVYGDLTRTPPGEGEERVCIVARKRDLSHCRGGH